MNPTICRQCGGPIVRGRWDTPQNPNICPKCEWDKEWIDRAWLLYSQGVDSFSVMDKKPENHP